jgi:hypothetical protein
MSESGVTGSSWLLKTGMKFVRGFPIDFLHTVILGTAKYILDEIYLKKVKDATK